jgi:hypothetical protein
MQNGKESLNGWLQSGYLTPIESRPVEGATVESTLLTSAQEMAVGELRTVVARQSSWRLLLNDPFPVLVYLPATSIPLAPAGPQRIH